jgi:NADH-quinone oxidoreductase subunit L
MFLALGVGAWSAAVFHFLTHAFFKSLLFLCAGVIILSLDHETSMFKMGGLRKKLPLVFWTFLIGALAISGVPPTAGFASKGLILYRVWNLPHGGPLLWVGALAGVIITSLYTFRMLFLTFFGESKGEPSRKTGFVMGLSIVVLAVFCFLLAGLNWPGVLGGFPFLTAFLEYGRPPAPHAASTTVEAALEAGAVAIGLVGIFLAWILFYVKPDYLGRMVSSKGGNLLHRFWFSGWGFDWVYNNLFVTPFVQATRKNRKDFIDRFYDGIAQLMEDFHGLLSLTQNGNLRWYAMSILLGAIIFMAVIIFS